MNVKNLYEVRFCFLFIIFVLTILALGSCRIKSNATYSPRKPESFHDPIALPPPDSGEVDYNTWRAAAFPGFACPDDNITFEWSVGNPRCDAGPRTSCQTLTVSDNLAVLEPFTSRDLSGTQSYGSVSSIDSWSGEDVQFTFSVAHDDPDDAGWISTNDEVVIIRKPPGTPTGQDFNVTAVCNADSGRWNLTDFRLNMGREPFIEATGGLGHCVRINSLCYNGEGSVNYNPIIVSIINPATGEAVNSRILSRGDCVDGIILKPDLIYQVVPDPSNPIISTTGGNCIYGSTSDPATPAPYITLEFSLTCDTTLPECGN